MEPLDDQKPQPVSDWIRANPFWVGVILICLTVITAMEITDNSQADPPATTQRASTETIETGRLIIPQMFLNIDEWTPTETDCANLESWLTGVKTAHGNQTDREALNWLAGLHGRIVGRMQVVGC